MSKEQLTQFEDAVQNSEELQDEVQKMGQDLAGIVAVGEREGYAFTEAELADYMANYRPETGRELSDEELANVTGAGYTEYCTVGDACV